MNVWIEQQKYLIDFTLASLARRKAKNLGLLLVYALIVFLLASVMLLTHALRQAAAELLAGAPEVVLQRMVAGRHDLIPPGYLERIGRLRGVQEKQGRLWGYYYDPVVRANYTFMVAEDRLITPGTLVVGAGLARTRGVAPGNLISFRAYSGKLFTFSIADVLPAKSELVSADLVLLSETDFRAFFDIPPGHFTDIALRVANPLEVRNVASKLAQQFPDSRPILREEILRTYESIFHWREGIVLALAVLAILAFAILAWEKASGLSADERREIGILKAVGWETGDVLRMKFWEGALLSLSAFLIGYLGAYVHVFHFSASLFAPVLRGWAVLYPRFELSPVIDGLQVATLFFFTVFPYAAATLVPIWRAAITDPDAVMRG
ncbi:MAG TPA: FtsX-like permease family protein [Candidatus Accumulibacter phosphatis]|nr:MAG: outer membrane-specific lipoprotein transporter subunit LolC [Candidatus Accumulibacter sp. SK-11]HAY29261.1 ABC transporter permease [Accumulibacter sp.]HCN69122.1 ABC transporter permease [Accumulibacter sp.]HRL76452.1 FtsX-like permease family protein [Candidatus Accumulibacter phosphatis]HRQ95850.1 FtsX-like permease family protein [Candidatus Accumulibacter phosphatis]